MGLFLFLMTAILSSNVLNSTLTRPLSDLSLPMYIALLYVSLHSIRLRMFLTLSSGVLLVSSSKSLLLMTTLFLLSLRCLRSSASSSDLTLSSMRLTVSVVVFSPLAILVIS